MKQVFACFVVLKSTLLKKVFTPEPKLMPTVEYNYSISPFNQQFAKALQSTRHTFFHPPSGHGNTLQTQ